MTIDAATEAASAGDVGLFASRVADVLARDSADSGRVWVARAPGRLDVMGGIAEYSGSLTLTAPIADAVYTAIAKRDDGDVAVHVLDPDSNGEGSFVRIPVSALCAGPGRWVEPHAFRATLQTFESPWVRRAAAVVYALGHHGVIADLDGGLTIVYRSGLPADVDVGMGHAVQAATCAAVAAGWGVQLDPERITKLCRFVDRELNGGGCGVGATVCALVGQPGALWQVRCQPHELIGPMPLPRGVTLLGIDSGHTHPRATAKRLDVRVSTHMGRMFIDRLIRTTGAGAREWTGYLARISVREYVERFRDRLPTKLKGRAFLDRFGDSGDATIPIDPGATYKIRSRTEHHIYENDRVHLFVEGLSRVARTGDRTALLETGELLYASHWSYGQRCGLGTIATDHLVHLLRQRGPAQGIYGARISGPGAGGTILVLLQDGPGTRAVVQEVVEAYRRDTGNSPRVIDGSSPGALVTGVRMIS